MSMYDKKKHTRSNGLHKEAAAEIGDLAPSSPRKRRRILAPRDQPAANSSEEGYLF